MQNFEKIKMHEDLQGLCPICKAKPIVRRVHEGQLWAACDRHQVKWPVRSPFNTDPAPPESECWRLWDQIKTFRFVRPFVWPREISIQDYHDQCLGYDKLLNNPY